MTTKPTLPPGYVTSETFYRQMKHELLYVFGCGLLTGTGAAAITGHGGVAAGLFIAGHLALQWSNSLTPTKP